MRAPRPPSLHGLPPSIIPPALFPRAKDRVRSGPARPDGCNEAFKLGVPVTAPRQRLPAARSRAEAEPEPERPLLASQSEPTFQAYVENLPERRKPPRRSKAALAPFPKPENAALPPPKKRPTRFKSVDEWAPKA